VTETHLAVNRASWDERAPAHAASVDYAFHRFRADPGYLSAVVRFDLERLGDIRGMRGVHLQCHIGTDTVSLARLGAQMTGLDFSPPALAEARRLNELAGTNVEFVESELYAAPSALGGRTFDLVFTGIGALCWLPSIRGWAEVVSQLLAPGGRLFIREGHPMLWALDERQSDQGLVVDLPYFETADAVVWEETGTYVETDVAFEQRVTHVWNHGLGEIFTAVQDVGLQVTMLVEHDSVPWNALPGQMEQIGLDEWRLIDRPWRLPHTFTLQAIKSG
jgi:SAM-dependent methyltransferase